MDETAVHWCAMDCLQLLHAANLKLPEAKEAAVTLLRASSVGTCHGPGSSLPLCLSVHGLSRYVYGFCQHQVDW